MSVSWNGIYAAYMTGAEGNGFAMYIFHDGKIVGSDPLGVLFDGTYSVSTDGALAGKVKVSIPPNGSVIQGVTAGPSGMTYEVDVAFEGDLEKVDFIRLDTPLGPVNLKMKKLRSIGETKDV
jgi:hypothetical protein